MFLNQIDSHNLEIEEVLQKYFYGYLNAEAEILAEAFHPSARLFNVDEEKLSTTEMNPWLENLRQRQGGGDVRQGDVKIVGIDVSGEAAISKVELRFSGFSFIDYLSLLKIDGKWIIINKIYQRIENK